VNSLVILHGSFGSPSENWFPWLAAQWSAETGEPSLTPAFPTPKGQTFANWATILDAYRAIGLVTEATAVVAHSSACVFAVKYASSRDCRFKSVTTVAGFNDFASGDADFDSINAELFVEDDTLRQAPDLFAARSAFYSDNDPYLPREKLDAFAQAIDATVTVVSGGGHLNAEAGYTEFPKLLAQLLAART
jgi:uncharacterized protein